MTSLLITGVPGVGKTTLIRNIAQSLENFHPAGFYTREVRKGGLRVGFDLVGLNGQIRTLAHITIAGRYRVGKYGVDIPGFDEFLKSLTIPSGDRCLIIIDEIGKMECFSAVFREMITRLLEDDCLLIATIAKRGNDFIEQIKKRHDVLLFELTRDNRDTILPLLLENIRSQGSGRPTKSR
jgi:nucleoside-triphosphatase